MKKLKIVNTLLVIGVFTTTSMVGAPFAQAQSIDQQIKALEAERSQDQANAGLLGGQAQDIQGQISDLQTQIASIQAQINSNAAKQNELTSQIESALAKLEEQKDLLSANVRAMYIEGDISPLEMIASSKSLGDFVDRQEYRDRIKDNVSSTIDEIERLKKQLDEQRQEIVRVLDEHKSLRGNLATKENEANQKLAQTNQDKEEFDKAVSSKTNQIASLRAQQLVTVPIY